MPQVSGQSCGQTRRTVRGSLMALPFCRPVSRRGAALRHHTAAGLDLHPAPLLLTLQDRLAQRDLAVAVGERRERARRGQVAAVDVVVDRAEQLLEAVG